MLNRRQFISMAAVAASGATAGCGAVEDIAESSGSQGGGSGGSVTTLTPDSVLELLHAPGSFGDADHYSFSWSSPTAVDALYDELDNEEFEGLVRQAGGTTRGNLIDAAGVDFWDVGTLYNAGPASALVGDFNRRDVGRQLRYEGLEYQGNYEGFALIESPDSQGSATLAIEGEGRIDDEDAPSDISRIYVGEATQDTGSTSVVQTIIDVAGGMEDRYSDEVAAVDPLVNGLSSGVLMEGETFEAVDPDGRPDADLAHEAIPIGQQQSGTLTADSTATISGQSFSFMDRYGFAGAADSEVTITVTADGAWPASIILYTGNGDRTVRQGQSQLQATLPQDGAYNFVVFDQDQVRRSQGTEREYTIEVTIEGSGGPEAGVFAGETARGRSLRVDEDEAVRQWVLVFEDEPPMEEIDTWITENSDDRQLFGAYEEVTQEQDGSLAIIEGTSPISEVSVDTI